MNKKSIIAWPCFFQLCLLTHCIRWLIQSIQRLTCLHGPWPQANIAHNLNSILNYC